MHPKYFNRAEAGMNARLDPKETAYIPESSVIRSPEEAMNNSIGLIVENFKDRSEAMQNVILKDINLAINGSAEQKLQAKSRLTKFEIDLTWPDAVLGVLEDSLKDAKTQRVEKPDFRTEKGREKFHGLFAPKESGDVSADSGSGHTKEEFDRLFNNQN